jgi:nucleotide-binding universal stress UspA family protein
MSAIRKISAPAPSAEVAANAARAAVNIARAFSAEVEGVHIIHVPMEPVASSGGVGAPYTHEYYAALEEAARERAAATEAAFNANALGKGVAAAFRSQRGVAPYDYAALARLADLVVAGRTDKGAPPESGLFEELVFQSGRPVYVAAREPRPQGAVILAWNGSREAARALSAGLPFFETAPKTCIVTIGEPSPAAAGLDDAVAFLRSHGAKAEGVTLPRTRDVDDALLAEARRVGASLIVAGAWSHSRFREIILGGVTKSLLAQSEFDLLLAH